MEPAIVLAKFEINIALPVSEIIAIGVLDEGCELANANYGKRRLYGIGNGTVRKSVGDFL